MTMRRGFNLLFFGLALWMGVAFVQADNSPPTNAGFIGVIFSRGKDADFPVVDYVAAQSSAALAGIIKGDSITAINGVTTRKMSAVEARHALEGDIGGTVELTIPREGGKEDKVSVVRKSLLDTYMPAINAGDVRAEVTLGYFYEHGPASVIDPAKAFYWYQKAADSGNAAGERSLGTLYFYGTGVKQSDKDAFAWFYPAAMQDEGRAEYYLGLFYQNGRAVERNEQTAYYWYDRSARQGIANAEWNLAYAYEKGLGVKANTEEALKWYQKAQASLPDNAKLKQHIAILSLKAFVENPDTNSLDTALVMTLFGRYLMLFFYFLAGLYVVGGAILFYFSFRAVETSVGILVALGWLVFQLEGQAVAFMALIVLGASLTASTFFVVTCFFSAVPLIASSFGPNRRRIWKASAASWQVLFQYGLGAYVMIFVLLLGYDKIYLWATHAALPGQPTEVLIDKAKHGSVWLAFACVALALPLAEEVLFRGYLFEALKRYLPDAPVVILTAFGFAFVHFQGIYFAPLFGFGLVQGWVRLKTGSLRLPVLLHVLNNGLFLAMAS